MKTSRLFIILVVAIIALAVTATTIGLAATCDVVTVTGDDVARQAEDTPPTKNWVLYTRPASPGIGTFVVGPANPPLGVGSLRLQTTTGSDKVQLFNFDHVGTRLADINRMGYSTYRNTGDLQQVTALNILPADLRRWCSNPFTILPRARS
jgi:hypothetical protein